MSQTIADQLPSLYEGLLPDMFDRAAVHEQKATCDNCVMCAPSDQKAMEGVTYFNPSTKCCTYSPRLPNYLVGGVLADPGDAMDEGRRRLRAKIASRIGVTPLWLAPPKKFKILLEASRRSSFGRSTELLCPYYDTGPGNCTIWKFRETDCTTFFCKYDATGDGQAYWRALSKYLYALEPRLAKHAIAEVAPELVEPRFHPELLSIEELEDRPPPASEYTAHWRAWEGREAELYVACRDVVAGLDRTTVDRLMRDDEPARRLTLLQKAHDQLIAPKLPARLKKNPEIHAWQTDEGSWIINSYSRYELTPLPDSVFALLDAFDGSDGVEESKARLLRDHDAEFDDAALMQLFQLRLLIAAE